MAFRMKHWIAVTVSALALVAVWRLPPEPRFDRVEEPMSAEMIRYQRLNHELQVATGTLFRNLWADSLASLAIAEAEDGVAVLGPPIGEGTPEQLARLDDRVREQLDEHVGSERRMLFAWALQPHNHRQDDGAYSARDRTETYVGTQEGIDYCLQVRVAPSDWVRHALGRRIARVDLVAPRSNDLGPCRFYLAHGMPGPEVADWLEAGGLDFAYEFDDAPDVGALGGGRRTVFGFTRGFALGPGAVEIDRCMAGVATACAWFLETPQTVTSQQREILRGSRAIGLGAGSAFRWLRDRPYLLADLESEFGREAFGAFWTSDRPFAEAFEQAFGMDHGTWMVSWLERTVGIDRPGPGLPKQASTGAMLTIGLLLGAAYWRRRERRVVS